MFNQERVEEGTRDHEPEVPTIKEINAHVESHANYKGNWWLVQLERFANPAIRKQMVDLWEKNEAYIQEHGIKEYAGEGEQLRDPVTGELMWLDEDLGLPKNEQLYTTVPYKALTRSEIESKLKEAIDREASFTLVDFDESRSESHNKPISYEKNQAEVFDRTNGHYPDLRTSVIGLQVDDTIPNQENTPEVMSLVEAHEKGHTVRTLHRSDYLNSLFSTAFSFPNSEEYLDTYQPSELIERMAQLKNYFGMKGDETFTPQHLEYARQHYLEDVTLDNNMKGFLDAITQDKEFAFLKLMNSIGI